jgi:hypothetical protein
MRGAVAISGPAMAVVVPPGRQERPVSAADAPQSSPAQSAAICNRRLASLPVVRYELGAFREHNLAGFICVRMCAHVREGSRPSDVAYLGWPG